MSLGADLGARFAVTSAKRSAERKKKNPRCKTLSCAVTLAMDNAANKLAAKLGVSRSRAVEIAIEKLCKEHGIEIEIEVDDV